MQALHTVRAQGRMLLLEIRLDLDSHTLHNNETHAGKVLLSIGKVWLSSDLLTTALCAFDGTLMHTALRIYDCLSDN